MGLFEYVAVMASGADGNIAIPFSRVSPAGTGFVKSLTKARCIDELCSGQKQRTSPDGKIYKNFCTPLENEEHAIAWERELSQNAPAHCEATAAQFGPNLLADTAEARAAATEYWKRLRQLSTETSLDRLEDVCREQATPDQRRKADKFAGLAHGTSKSLSYYQVASFAIQMFGPEIEGGDDPFPFDSSYSSNEQLKWRTLLLVDILAREPIALRTKDPRWLPHAHS